MCLWFKAERIMFWILGHYISIYIYIYYVTYVYNISLSLSLYIYIYIYIQIYGWICRIRGGHNIKSVGTGQPLNIPVNCLDRRLGRHPLTQKVLELLKEITLLHRVTSTRAARFFRIKAKLLSTTYVYKKYDYSWDVLHYHRISVPISI